MVDAYEHDEGYSVNENSVFPVDGMIETKLYRTWYNKTNSLFSPLGLYCTKSKRLTRNENENLLLDNRIFAKIVLVLIVISLPYRGVSESFINIQLLFLILEARNTI